MNDYSKVKTGNEMELIFSAVSENEGLARVAAAAFVATKNPTLEEVADIKTAVSEAVTNAIIHGYEEEEGKVILRCRFEENVLWVEVEDKGVGIENIDRAMEPMYTTKPDMERSGMGFSFMEAFMDHLEVESELGSGTTITMRRTIKSCEVES